MTHTDGQGNMVIRIPIGGHEDIVLARQQVRDISAEMGFSLLDQTRIVTAVSELARNVVVHAHSGFMSVFQPLERPGLRIVFQDQGPGIEDVAKAMQDSYSSVGSLGLGLQGAKRLTDAMEISSVPGKGTVITITKWLS
jgi:serine/threonine-protein kinase RsbT